MRKNRQFGRAAPGCPPRLWTRNPIRNGLKVVVLSLMLSVAMFYELVAPRDAAGAQQEAAPDFILANQDGQKVTLRQFRGKI